MGVEDNYFEISDLDANTTFYDWVSKENSDIIEKLNLIAVYGASAGSDNIVTTVGSTGNSYDNGDIVVDLAKTITGITISGDLRLLANLIIGGTTAESIVSSVNGITGAVTIAGITGSTGAEGGTGETPDPIYISDNHLINSAFDIWQRGSSFTGTGSIYFSDRWARFVDSDTITDQIITTSLIERYEFAASGITNSSQTTVLGDPVYYTSINMGLSSGVSADAHFIGIENRIEGGDRFFSEDMIVDGYVKTSGLTGATLDIYLRRNTNGSTYSTELFSNTVLAGTADWTPFLVNHTGVSTGVSFDVDGYTAVGIKLNNLPTGQTLDVAYVRAISTQGVTITASPYRPKIDPEHELIRCSRYYQRSYELAESAGDITLTGTTPTWSSIRFVATPANEYWYTFPVKMRKQPTVTFYSPTSGVENDGFNRSSGLDIRLSSGTIGYLNESRVHAAGADTLAVYPDPKGIRWDLLSGVVVFDDIFVHYIADADFSI